MPVSLRGYDIDNINTEYDINTEYEAQLPWPELDPFRYQHRGVKNFDDDDYPVETTYYTPRGIDGNLDPIHNPDMTLQPLTAAGGVTSSSWTQQPAYEASPSVIPGTFNRLEIPGQPAPMMMSMREAEEPMPASIMLQPLTHPLNMPSPLSVISPPPSAKSSARKRNVSAAGLERSPVAPKKRVIKPQLTTKVDNSEDFEIQKDSEMTPTGTYQGYFHTVDVARKKLQRLLELYRKPRENCSFPSTDDTFPTGDDDKMGYIKNLFDAINDWSHFREWSQALNTDDRNRIIDGLRRRQAGHDDAAADISLDDMRPSQQELESILPPLQAQQKKILGRLLSDQTVEWLCWELVVRTLFADPRERRWEREQADSSFVIPGGCRPVPAGNHPDTALVRRRRSLGGLRLVCAARRGNVLCFEGKL